ncbi:hypothetical protein M0R36_10120 [bacterium]|jgi:hypothetical protein|nr:hypothetical protein [bacterium]
MKKKKLQHSNFLNESLETKWASKQIVNIVFNFDRTFQRFRRYYPNCPINDLINNKITVMYEIVDELKDKIPDIVILKRILGVILKLVWKMDEHMVKYINEEEKKEKEEEEKKSTEETHEDKNKNKLNIMGGNRNVK